MKHAPMLLAAIAMAATVAAAISGCTVPGASKNTGSSFVGQWVLVSASDEVGKLPLNGTYITLTIDEGESASGRGPCSDYQAKIIGRPGPVFVSVTDRAIAMCTDSQSPQLDHRYLTALHDSSVGSIDGDDLTFSSPKTRLRYHRVAHFMIGGIVDIPWDAQYETLIEPDGSSADFSDPAGAIILLRDYTFRMSVGACPDLTGRWTQDAGEIVLDHVAHATAACTTPDDNQNRADVMSALSQGFQFSIGKGTLVTTNPRNHTFMSFRAGNL
ncbi:MAG TPA: META domain-containing protein [Galbitalea sp.]|jgi:heat shock protein HslJ